MVSGSSAINYGFWARGHSVDYYAWAKVVGDSRWNYESILGCFGKTESHYDPNGNGELHGFNSLIPTTAGTSDYPLGENTGQALATAGVKFNPDANNGYPFGFGSFTENWKNARRNPA